MSMRFLLATLLTAAFAFIAGMFLPWWSIAIVSFLVALFLLPNIGLGFLSGFLGIFILWGFLSLWIDLKNESILSGKIAQIIPLGGSSILLILVTAFVGAIVGGFAAMAGSSLAPVMVRK
ncbi:hypothetical protein SAMN02745131_02630 [Flavisolibacter ginsengisoli DSM 18119]|uniref:Uncharacterized protein n=2 Tax=Flavisolibacter TaxID=398041 RepID=A0A1M5BKW7_9BACT|nr:hypothetical protein SAMN02745131_02630 [Flavisolibacter ginsengisoli DSM 18119]